MRYSLRTLSIGFLVLSTLLGAVGLYPYAVAWNVIQRWERKENRALGHSNPVGGGLSTSSTTADMDAEELLKCGDPAVYMLRTALGSENDQVRFNAVVALHEFGERAAPAVPELKALLASGDMSIRRETVICLGKIGTGAREAIAELEQIVEADPKEEEVLDTFYGPDGIVLHNVTAKPLISLAQSATASLDRIRKPVE